MKIRTSKRSMYYWQRILMRTGILLTVAVGIGALVLLTRPPAPVFVLRAEAEDPWWTLQDDALTEYLRQAIACTDKLSILSGVEDKQPVITVVTDRQALDELSRSIQRTHPTHEWAQSTYFGPYYYLDFNCKQRIRLEVYLETIAVGPWGDGELPDPGKRWLWSRVVVSPEFREEIEGLIEAAKGRDGDNSGNRVSMRED